MRGEKAKNGRAAGLRDAVAAAPADAVPQPELDDSAAITVGTVVQSVRNIKAARRTNGTAPRATQPELSWMTEADRHYWWDCLSKVLRLQRWWRRSTAQQSADRRMKSRTIGMIETYRTECAEMIQRAWRDFAKRRRRAAM